MATPYRAALDEEWDKLNNVINEKGVFGLLFPQTAAKDTLFHLAVFSKSEEPLKSLLDIAKDNPMTMSAYSAKNIYGNTALHEAAADGNIEAVKLLVKHDEKLLEVRNNEGETPLFKAAAYGKKDVVLHLVGENRRALEDNIHRHREKPGADKPEASILHAAIQGENFETAIKLLKLDESLATLKDGNGMTSLQLLATMPSAFRSGYRMSMWKRLLYFCPFIEAKRRIGLPILKKILEDKRKHELAFELSRTLIERDTTWQEFMEKNLNENFEGLGNIQATQAAEGGGSKPIALFLATERGIVEIVNEILKQTPQLVEYIDDKNRNMLHIAIMHRQKELFDLVKEMNIPMKRLVRGIQEDGYTILHHAADKINDNADIYRGPAYYLQEELKWYKRVEKLAPTHFAMFRVTPKDDNKEDKNCNCKELFDLIHKLLLKDAQKSVKDETAKDDNKEAKSYNCKELFDLRHNELLKDAQKSVKDETAKDDNKEAKSYNCKELFDLRHNELLKDAQKWVKETSQSCSAVAVLVATVVFAAAYTVPGGSNEKGYPVFLNNNFFLVFTVMDVVALACSLTSVVMFLSVLTSPFSYNEFLNRLPRKLEIGFSLLFVALTTTMLAFAATLLLIVRYQKPRWTTTLIYTAAFFPVSIFALTQFPMYVAFKVSLLAFCKWIKKALPRKWFKKRLQTNFLCYKKPPQKDVSSKKNDDHGARPPV